LKSPKSKKGYCFYLDEALMAVVDEKTKGRMNKSYLVEKLLILWLDWLEKQQSIDGKLEDSIEKNRQNLQPTPQVG